ncbi:MAG: hypothetical protein ACSHWW_13755 [Nonlabens sp.]|uniref:hypothetical protein n=1 Tax=Nonlabens sp. TaxID=1888209 RepID=UPI003EF59062
MKKEANRKRIVLFSLIAITLSNIFRFDIFNLKTELQQLPTWVFIFSSLLLEGSGVVIGALISILLLKGKREIEITLRYFKIKKPLNGCYSHCYFNNNWSRK